MWGCSRIFLRNIAFLGSKKQQQRHSHEAVKPKTAPGSPDAPNVADVHPITASRKGLMSKVKENDIKMSFAMKYPKYFKIQLIVHRISAMFHLFFAPIDFPHHRLISRKTHPGSWLFTSFHPNVARSIPSFKKIHAFSRLCTTPPPLTSPSGKINMSKNRVFLLLRKGGHQISIYFLALGSFSHFRSLFGPHKIHRDATSRGFLQCTLESATTASSRDVPSNGSQAQGFKHPKQLQGICKGCWLSHISVICYGKVSLCIAFVLSCEYWNL